MIKKRSTCTLLHYIKSHYITLKHSTVQYIAVQYSAVEYLDTHRLVGLVDKASTSRAEDPVFKSRFATVFFSGSSHISDFKIATPVATLSGAGRFRVSAGTGRPGISIL